jgi:hypothetical protein
MSQAKAFTIIGAMGLSLVMMPSAPSSAAVDPRSFDGNWLTTISCPNAAGALGYSYQFPAQIREGVLHGERHAGQPGQMILDGRILPDGSADIYARGIVSAPEYTPGQIPKGTDYAYHIAARFEGTRGTGSRIEGRPCSVTFVRQ